MARNPLIDTDFASTRPDGHDSAGLGPGDSSDSGSGVASIAPDDGVATDSGRAGERRGASGATLKAAAARGRPGRAAAGRPASVVSPTVRAA
jgi:hypothetical protein